MLVWVEGDRLNRKEKKNGMGMNYGYSMGLQLSREQTKSKREGITTMDVEKS